MGWIFVATSFSASLRSSPAKTTTEVVPSPTSSSWTFEISNHSIKNAVRWNIKIPQTNFLQTSYVLSIMLSLIIFIIIRYNPTCNSVHPVVIMSIINNDNNNNRWSVAKAVIDQHNEITQTFDTSKINIKLMLRAQ